MTGDERTQAHQADDLRARADEMVQDRTVRTPEELAALSPEEIRQILHELRVHQIELELQNEELRAAQEQLDASRARYFDLYDLAPVGYCTVSASGLILEANLTAATMLGVARVELVRQPLSRFVLKEDQDSYYLHRERLFESGEPQDCELRMVKPDGAALWVHMAATAAQDDDGAPICLVVVSDISARKEVEAALERERRLLRTVIDGLPDAIYAKDLETRKTVVNRADLDNIGAESEAAVLGKTDSELFPRDLAERYYADDRVVLESGEPMLDHEERLVRPDGEERWLLTSKLPLRDSVGRVVGLVGIGRDITERKQAQAEREQLLAQVQEQERLATVGRLAAGIAHDFNNIMATIILYAQMMVQSEALSKADRERASVITEQGWHAARLVEQILDFGRRTMLDRRSCDLLAHLRTQAELLGRTLPESIAIELEHGEDDYVVYADPTRMQVMITNLAVNARDAMPDGGTLRLSLERITVGPDAAPPLMGLEAGEWVRLRVADTGTGLAPEALAHLFEPFFTTKEPGKGSGLGLAQVYGIVVQHEGRIGVESRVGEGTAFSIYLPALNVRATETLPLDMSAMPQGKGETVLVVEDEEVLRFALREILEMLGYRALEATDGESALALIEAQGAQIALVLSDVVMPKMGGVALLQALREKRWETPVILLTGHPVNSELEALRAQGLSDWVTKPPTIERLAQALSDALHR